MTAMTNYLENKLVDHLLRGASFSAPSTLYVGLFTVSPSDAGGGTECTGGGYGRVAVTCNGTNWSATDGAGTTGYSAGDSGTISNNVSIKFPLPTATWGTVVAVGLFNTQTGGNLLLQGSITEPVLINTDSAEPEFEPGALTFQIDN